jgi:hypothetical protein
MFTLHIPSLGRGAIHTTLIAVAAAAVGAVLSATITHNLTISKASASNEIAPIDPTCTSSLPCIEYDNNGSGPGIRGISVNGNGLAGSTKNISTSVSTGREGLIGNDISTSGNFNAGVRGLSVRGSGVAGQSGTGAVASTFDVDGVFGNSSGSSSSIGVEGFTGPVGLSGSRAGVQGNNNLTSTAVRANGFGGPLFVGNNHAGSDVFTVDDGGNLSVTGNIATSASTFVGGNESVSGFVLGGSSSASLGGEFIGNSEGLIGSLGGTPSGAKAGVEGINSTDVSSIAVKANGLGGLLFDGNNASFVDSFKVDDAGNINITGQIFTGGTCASGCARTPGKPGVQVQSYTPKEAVPTIEDFGEAQLVAGQVYVHLDPVFANAIEQRANYLVFITPEGDNRGLYVTQKSTSGFVVRESQGGRSTLAFSYRIVAKPFGTEGMARLQMVVLRAVPKLLPVTPGIRQRQAAQPRMQYVPKRGLIVGPNNWKDHT